MKFCGKCHKMVTVKPITNASDLTKRCYCDSDAVTILAGNVASSLAAYVLKSHRTDGRRKVVKIIKEVFQGAEEWMETE